MMPHCPPVRSTLSALALFTLLSAPLGAQKTGRIEGTITDSIHAAPLVNANVLAVRIEPEPSVSSGASTDARGRYHIDSLAAGRYMVEFASPLLDSLEITLPPREASVAEGRVTRIDFALPSGQTLRLAACPGVALDKGTGAVVGRLSDADTDQPLAGAKIVVAWRELTVDRKTMTPSIGERTGAVTSDSVGRYRLCGVPTGDWLMLQVQANGRSGSAIRIQVPDSAGVVVRHLSLSTASARPIADSTDAAAADTTLPPPLEGTAAVSGVIRGVGGLPLSGAQIRLVGARGTTLSDERGRFELRDLPAGTQVLEVRRIGYLLAQQPVELRAGRPVFQDVRLQRIVTLDSLRVLAQRSRYPEFEQHRRMSGFGTFLTADEVARRVSFETSDLFRMIPGFRVSGYGLDAKVTSSRGVTSLTGACSPNIVIDGMPDQEINLIHPSSIGAMEIYRAGQPVPPQYDRGCGAIVIWSR
jgi:Carboxypeptidase regulatory-like domain/TonB-dependent Receptor Plug Domain